MMMELQGLTHEVAVVRLRQAIQGTQDGALEMIISLDGITVDQDEGSSRVDPPPHQVSS